MKTFLDEDFLLNSTPARRLYRDYAARMPIFDYHCHLPPDKVARNHQFQNLTQIWLQGDHYKWRAMRSAGIEEHFITGSASDREKFLAWAQVVPQTIGNPLYHWTHLELKKPFGLTQILLNPETAEEIYNTCNTMLQTPAFQVRNILSSFHVKAICTTDDPLDPLEHHKTMAQNPHLRMFPTFRPDKAMAIEDGKPFTDWITRLSELSAVDIHNFPTLLQALEKRHTYFHQHGCRLSDHAFQHMPSPSDNNQKHNLETSDKVFQAALKPETDPSIIRSGAETYRHTLLTELARMNQQRNWTMQLHLGALRNTNTRMLHSLGPDTGFDTIADEPMAQALTSFLNTLDSENQLPRTIIYNLNPRDNDLIAALIGCFQTENTPGKIQFGSGWWFNDQKTGMLSQLTSLANMGLLSRFIGMLTDSRSFLSWPRHEYFRRLLCRLIGQWIQDGEAPADYGLLGSMVQDICYQNVVNYLQMEIE